MSVIESITGVFSNMFNWISGSLSGLIPIFYDPEKGLTFFGTLSIVALSISVFFLIIGLIQNFLHLRG